MNAKSAVYRHLKKSTCANPKKFRLMMDTAMIFAAGLGTRLAPLTDDRPKALVEFAGKTMLERTIEKLVAAGIRKIIINTHHFHTLMEEFVSSLHYPAADLILSDESDFLMDTGGGLKKAAALMQGEKPFLVHNVDVISDVNLKDMYEKHTAQRALASLAVSTRPTSRYFLWYNNRLCGWENIQTGDVIRCYPTAEPPELLAFSGIHIIDPAIFGLMEEGGKFSINQVYLRLAKEYTIVPYRHNPRYWADLGSVPKMEKALRMLADNPKKFDNI